MHGLSKIRKILDDRDKKYIFFIYSEESKAYKVFNLITKKVIVSKDVEFKEEKSWDGSIGKTLTIGAPILQ